MHPARPTFPVHFGLSPVHLVLPLRIKPALPVGIRSIAAGGWISAALSVDGDLYVWGNTEPGCEESAEFLRREDDEDVKLVELEGEDNIKDVAVGDGHIVAVTDSPRSTTSS